jgi:uncharacterized protein (TIGR03790 family)
MSLPKLLEVGLAVLIWSAHLAALAGGSGLNTLVIVNGNSSNSCELANYFCERRQVPPENVVRISWPGGNISWTTDEFQTNLFAPLLAALSARGLSNQIDYVVLSMDIPFQTINGTFVDSTTAALFYGFQTQSTISGYAGSEMIFRFAKPVSSSGSSFLATMITSDSLAAAKQLVDQGVLSDGTFPTNPVVLAKSSDSMRNVRYTAYDHALFNTRVHGNYWMVRTNSDSPAGQTNLLGYQTGLAGFTVSPATFVPGAIADSMTSFGGIIFGPNGQTSLLAFINAGAAGSYGTVTEPYIDNQKFPDPQVYFYQARGFTLAECYYQSLADPYQGLILGEPLAAPFASTGSGQWLGVSSNAVLSSITSLSLHFTAANQEHPLRQVDLFVDGKFSQTLTNVPSLPGNVLGLKLLNSLVTCTVPTNATLASIASQLAAQINLPINTNATGVSATAHGDRIELLAANTNRPAPPSSVRKLANQGNTNSIPLPSLVTNSPGTAPALTTFLVASRNAFLPSPISAMKSFTLTGTIAVGAWVQAKVTKASGSVVTISATNQSASATSLTLAAQMVQAINTSPVLQDLDGISAENPIAVWSNISSIELRVRGAGIRGAKTKVKLTASTGLTVNPATELPFDENLSDLRPLNHVYVQTGVTNLNLTFPLDTSALPDGFHQLTAVAYEGTHVRTQTRVSLPIRIQNTSLSATLNLLDLPNPSPVSGAYHIQVTASTNNVSAITLYSTGGQLNTISNQSTATFTVNGSDLGAGLHPFYALIEALDGSQYRTDTQWVRLTN